MAQETKEVLSDEQLLRSHLTGDPKAFEELYLRYEKGIFFLVRQFFRDRAKAEEVFQEVFMKLLDRADRFHWEGSFKSWFWSLARNHCIDRIRYHARRPEIPGSALGSDPNQEGAPLEKMSVTEAQAENQAYEKEILKHLDEALQTLPEEQRETFLLKERGGLTFEEIAQTMKVSVNTAKSRMRYALAALRRALSHKAFIKEART